MKREKKEVSPNHVSSSKHRRAEAAPLPLPPLPDDLEGEEQDGGPATPITIAMTMVSSGDEEEDEGGRDEGGGDEGGGGRRGIVRSTRTSLTFSTDATVSTATSSVCHCEDEQPQQQHDGNHTTITTVISSGALTDATVSTLMEEEQQQQQFDHDDDDYDGFHHNDAAAADVSLASSEDEGDDMVAIHDEVTFALAQQLLLIDSSSSRRWQKHGAFPLTSDGDVGARSYLEERLLPPAEVFRKTMELCLEDEGEDLVMDYDDADEFVEEDEDDEDDDDAELEFHTAEDGDGVMSECTVESFRMTMEFSFEEDDDDDHQDEDLVDVSFVSIEETDTEPYNDVLGQ